MLKNNKRIKRISKPTIIEEYIEQNSIQLNILKIFLNWE